jgi:hypothetical protein
MVLVVNKIELRKPDIYTKVPEFQLNKSLFIYCKMQFSGKQHISYDCLYDISPITR